MKPEPTAYRSRATRCLGVALIATLPFLAACDDDGPAGTAGDSSFQVLLTGASNGSAALANSGVVENEHDETPATGDRVSSAEVWISQIYLVGGGHGRVDLFVAENAEDRLYLDLMDVTTDDEIGLTDEIPVPEDRYGQLRFVVDSAHVTLEEDHMFADGEQDRPAVVPSDELRINLHSEILIEGGENHIVLMDFDLSRGFAFQGPPFAPHGVIMKPVLFQQVGHQVQ